MTEGAKKKRERRRVREAGCRKPHTASLAQVIFLFFFHQRDPSTACPAVMTDIPPPPRLDLSCFVDQSLVLKNIRKSRTFLSFLSP